MPTPTPTTPTKGAGTTFGFIPELVIPTMIR